MTATLVQSKHAYAAAATVTVTFDTPPTPGNLLVFTYGGRFTTDSNGIINPIGQVHNTDSDMFATVGTNFWGIVGRVALAGAPSSYTVTNNGPTQTELTIMEFAPTPGKVWAGWDQSAFNTGSYLTTLTSMLTGTQSDTDSVSIICGIPTASTPLAGTVTMSNGFNILASSNLALAAYKCLTDNSPQNTVMTWGVSTRSIHLAQLTYRQITPKKSKLVQFKRVSVASGPVPALVSVTLDQAPKVGNLLVAAMGVFASPTGGTNPFGKAPVESAIWYQNSTLRVGIDAKVVEPGDGQTYSFTIPIAGAIELTIMEFSPATGKLWSPLPADASGTSGVTTSQGPLNPSAPATVSDEAVAILQAYTTGAWNSGTQAPAISDDFAGVGNVNRSLVAYKILDSRAAVSPSFSWIGGAKTAGACVVLFKQYPTDQFISFF